jgi:hypothetical protein
VRRVLEGHAIFLQSSFAAPSATNPGGTAAFAGRYFHALRPRLYRFDGPSFRRFQQLPVALGILAQPPQVSVYGQDDRRF